MSASRDETIRYEPDEPSPPLIALGVGLQGVMLVTGRLELNLPARGRLHG